jgi:hypothetical protein
MLRTSGRYKALGHELKRDLLRTSGRGRILDLSCYHCHLSSILEIRVDLWVLLCMLWLSPRHTEIFLITELTTPLGRYPFLGIGCCCY